MRRTITMMSLAAALPFVLAPGGAAGAAESVEGMLEDAKTLVERRAHLEAATLFGDAIALAHRNADLQGEQAAALAFSKFVDEVPELPAAAGSATSDAGPSRAAVLAAAMGRLDAKRSGAFVSAHALARNVLQLATETGDLGAVADACRVATTHAARPNSGAGSAAAAKYAEGMRSVAGNDPEAAKGQLEAAFGAAAKAGWLDLASHAGTELAAARFRGGDADGARTALEGVTALLARRPSRTALQRWRRCVETRLADAPEDVRRPLTDALGSAGGGSAGAAGGRGGRGGAGGGADPVSDVGRLLPKLAKGKPFVSVRRTPDGLEILWATAPDRPPARALDDDMVRHADEGGVTLSFHGASVALRMVDLKGLNGQPGESSEPDAARAFYLLAEKETWSVGKDGVVTVSSR